MLISKKSLAQGKRSNAVKQHMEVEEKEKLKQQPAQPQVKKPQYDDENFVALS